MMNFLCSLYNMIIIKNSSFIKNHIKGWSLFCSFYSYPLFFLAVRTFCIVAFYLLRTRQNISLISWSVKPSSIPFMISSCSSCDSSLEYRWKQSIISPDKSHFSLILHSIFFLFVPSFHHLHCFLKPVSFSPSSLTPEAWLWSFIEVKIKKSIFIYLERLYVIIPSWLFLRKIHNLPVRYNLVLIQNGL